MKKHVLFWGGMAVAAWCITACSPGRPAVPKNEYLIHGQLENVPDGTVIRLEKEENNMFFSVAADTLKNGEFFFRDTVSALKPLLVASSDKGFPGAMLDVWVAPGEYIQITGKDKLIKTWQTESDLPEQQEESKYRAAVMPEQKKLMEYEVEEYGLLRLMFNEHNGDEAFIKKNFPRVDSIRELAEPLRLAVWKKELDYMKTAPVTGIWMEKLRFYASNLPHESVMPYRAEVEELFARIPEAEKQTALGQEIAAYVYPDSTVGVGDKMVDGDLYDTEGRLHRLSEFEGRYILLDFWSQGCGPCLQSLPELAVVADAYRDKLAIVSISESPEASWKKFVREKKLDGNQWNELRNGRTGLSARYQVKGIPHYVLIAPDGIIREVWSGYGEGVIIGKMKEFIK